MSTVSTQSTPHPRAKIIPAGRAPCELGWELRDQTLHSATAFDQDIGAWNTASVSNMVGAFNGASAFNQNIAKWTVDRVTDFSNTFENVGLQGCYKRYIREAWGSTFQKAYGYSWVLFSVSTWYSTDRSTFLGLAI